VFPQLVLLKIIMHVEVGHPGFDNAVSIVDIDFDHLLHVTAHVYSHRPRYHGSSTSIALKIVSSLRWSRIIECRLPNIATDGERPHGYSKSICQPHNALYVGYIPWCNHSAANKCVCLVNIEYIVDFRRVITVLMRELVSRRNDCNIFQ